MHAPTRRTPTSAALAASALLALGGCWFATARSGSVLEGSRAARIEPGKTTRQDLLSWFGPPLALARRGQALTLPQGGVRPAGWREVQADTWFELFSTRHPADPDDLVYYYAAAQQNEFGVFLLVAGHSSRDVEESQLWVLLDGKTGVVKDLVYRKGGETVTPGAAPPPNGSP